MCGPVILSLSKDVANAIARSLRRAQTDNAL